MVRPGDGFDGPVVTVASITDGTSNTVAFSEGLTGTNGATKQNYTTGVNQNGPSGFYDVSQTITGVPATAPGAVMAAWLQGCNTSWATASAATQSLSTNRGWLWSWGMETMTMFNTIVPPNSKQYQWAGCRLDHEGGGFAFGQYSNATSAHPGGANVMMGDGSVRFVKDSINLQTWWALGSRNGGEILSADQY